MIGIGHDVFKGLVRVCIMGEPGAGKTRLAATFPAPFFIDLENGANSARPGGVNRINVETDQGAIGSVRSVIQRLGQSEFDASKRRLMFQPAPDVEPLPVGTLVIDSIDAIQQTVKMFRILRGRTKMKLEDWDTLLNEMQPMALEWGALPIHVVVVAHTKRTEKEEGISGMDFSVQGSLRSHMPRWFDYILHIATEADSKRTLITQPTIYREHRYTAKDRHGHLTAALQGNVVSIYSEDGWPTNAIARMICVPPRPAEAEPEAGLIIE
jgi:hypothetical protein